MQSQIKRLFTLRDEIMEVPHMLKFSFWNSKDLGKILCVNILNSKCDVYPSKQGAETQKEGFIGEVAQRRGGHQLP